jgi:hypothetical protein
MLRQLFEPLKLKWGDPYGHYAPPFSDFGRFCPSRIENPGGVVRSRASGITSTAFEAEYCCRATVFLLGAASSTDAGPSCVTVT